MADSNRTIPQEVPVLVVGAGPTGLTASALLAELGIPTLTVERREGVTPYSKALGVQARTLELFERLGIAEEACERGGRLLGATMLRDGEAIVDIPLGEIGRELSPYPFVLTLEQSQTEDLLLSAFTARGGEVHWSTEVESLEPMDDCVLATIRDENGVHEVRADWVVGADGASSLARKASGQYFVGGTYEERFLLIDTTIEGGVRHDRVSIDLLNEGVLALFPLPDEDHFRVIATVPEEKVPDELTDEDLVDLVQAASGKQLELGTPRWTSTYRIHHRKAEKFRVGRLLLAGDAAHVHSPIGGQGMNTGIGDAYNLAWKLARVVKGHAEGVLLDTYRAEREPFAELLLSSTDRAFELVAGRNPISGAFKRRGLPFVTSLFGKFDRVQKEVFNRVSQLSIRYPHSQLSIGPARWGELDPGDRAPDAELPDGTSLFDLLNGYRHDVLIFAGQQHVDLGALTEALGHLAQEAGWHELPADSAAARVYGATAGGVALIRPDGYLGVIAPLSEAAASFERYRQAVSAD